MSEKYYIVPLNEDTGIKELRVSTRPYSAWNYGKISGAVNAIGNPIEDMEFASQEAAMDAIDKFARHLAP